MLQGSLLRQDELDKKAIFLMGVRQEEAERGYTRGQLRERQQERLHENFGDHPSELTVGQAGASGFNLEFGEPPNRLISLNTNCMSCSDQPTKLLEAFKMACLSYKPSLVPFHNERLTRDSLLLLQD